MEYKIEALKEAFDGERTDQFIKFVECTTTDELRDEVKKFVTYHSAERFNVWQKVKIEQ